MKKPRGFGRLSPEERSEMGRKGGSSVDPKKRTFANDSKLASEAGRKGGQASVRPKKGQERGPKRQKA